LVPKLQRALGGSAGWSGFVVQLLFVAALSWIAYEIVANARANLQAQRITAGFGFLANTAGFDVSQNLVSYSGSDPYTRVFLVGVLNTLIVSVIGIFFATIIGFFVALGRLSPNWLLSRISGGYVELIRNLPLLFQILFWYLAVLAALPNPRQSISIFDSFFVSNRGLVIPKPIGEAGFEPFVAALLVAVLLSIPAGVRSARRRNEWDDRTISVVSLFGLSFPNFALGPILILLFSIKLGWLPVSGSGSFANLVLPAITMGSALAAILTRMVRTSMLEELNQDYVRTARAKGLSETTVVYRHALRNAMIPVITVLGLQFGALLAGAIVTEKIFSWPGIGRLTIDAIANRDYYVVQGCILAIGLTYIAVNFMTDLVYSVLNPRIRQ
jgi:general L-amino acid transport system permease protein